MIVVAIVGILAAVATGKFSELVTRSKEGRAKNFLGSIRSALSVYYSDNQVYPVDIVVGLITDEKYLNAIPAIEIPKVAGQGNPGHLLGNVVNGAFDDGATGNYTYVVAAQEGQIYINCSHNDSRGAVWSNQ